MAAVEWMLTPVGIDAHRWITRGGCRKVLVVAHTMVSCQRLLDVVECIEDDQSIQVVYTVAPDVFNHQVGRHLEDLGALVLPWEQVVRERFDLALAASYGGLHELHAPLIVMPHGAGHGKPVQPGAIGAPIQCEPPVYGLDAQRLIRNGRVIASAIVLSHSSELDILRRQCPPAVSAAVVAGDPCFDRLIASLPRRAEYRRALGVGESQELVVVSSTWGRDGLFGHWPDLLPSLMSRLPADRFRVAALLHPAVWSAHGNRQIAAWLRSCREAGLLLLDPTEDWRSLVVASDVLIGDHGSVTAYAAAIGRRVLLLPGQSGMVAAGSPQEVVASHASRLDPRRPLLPQLSQPSTISKVSVADRLTARPGSAIRILRRTMYQLLRLSEPARHRQVQPVPIPRRDMDGLW